MAVKGELKNNRRTSILQIFVFHSMSEKQIFLWEYKGTSERGTDESL